MDFFMPFTRNRPHAVETLEEIRQMARAMKGWRIAPTPYHELSWETETHTHRSTVGRIDPSCGEVVIAILRSDFGYMIFTPHFGVLDGDPILVPAEKARGVEEFADWPEAGDPVPSDQESSSNGNAAA